MKRLLSTVLIIINHKTSFSQLTLDAFTDQDITTHTINTNFNNPITTLTRTIKTSYFSFINSKQGPIHYQAPADITAIEDAYLLYTTKPSIDLSPSATSILRLTFANISQPFQFIASISDASSFALSGDNNEIAQAIDCVPSQSVYEIPIKNMKQLEGKGVFNISSVNKFNFLLNSSDSPVPDLALDLVSIELVPEPLSMLTMGSGVIAFLERRRKKLSKK